MSDELEKEVARLTAECAAPNEEAILMFRSAQKTINKLVEDANFLRDDNARLRLELSRRAPTEAAKPEAGLSEMERGAIENLTRFQGQCDEDGTNVVVSREALDVALDAVRRLSKSTPSAVSEAKEAGCICKGNWRLIVAENRALFDRKYTRNGQEFTFVGVVDASDDYYYLMTDDDGVAHLLSCVGSIEGHGFAQAPADGKEDGR